LGTFFRPAYGQALATRIDQLAAMAKEEPDVEQPSSDSLASLIAFLENNPTVKRPKLSIGPMGEFCAFWRADGAGEFSTRFLPNGSVRYLVKVPNSRNPNGVDRVSGDTTSDRLFDSAAIEKMTWVLSD